MNEVFDCNPSLRQAKLEQSNASLKHFKNCSKFYGNLIFEGEETNVDAGHIIYGGMFKLVTTVACLSLLLSAVWITLFRKCVYRTPSSL